MIEQFVIYILLFKFFEVYLGIFLKISNCGCFQIIGGGSRRHVTLSHRAQVKRFTSDLLRVLKSQSSKQIFIMDLPIVYSKYTMLKNLTAI